jgi:hypothetical protein
MRTFSGLVTAVKTATVLEYTTEEQLSIVRFSLWPKGLNTKYIRKDIFPVYGRKYLSRKAFHNLVAKMSVLTKRLKLRCSSG